MNRSDTRALEILRELGAHPAAPFFEERVARNIVEAVGRLGVDVRRDGYGNVIAHYWNESEPGKAPIAFVAHMDHPGFEVTEAGRGGVVARALGGVPVASLRKPTPVLMVRPDGGPPVEAEIRPPDEPAAADGSERLVTVVTKAGAEMKPPAYAVFDLPDFTLDGDTIRMRALDDLAGCASILAALERVVSEAAESDVYAVFTRAEEVGLFGARLLAESGALPEGAVVVSVESSSVIPGVSQGGGPIIRTGDASYTFDGEAEQALISARERIKQRDPGFKAQRQLMSGGTCEATAFAAFGYRATGIAFPLGNYHNATTYIADPEGGVGAEYIKLSDFLGGVELIAEAAGVTALPGESGIRERMRRVPDEARNRLESSVER